MSTPKKTFDITPHPRILQVLGEIEFKPWQCLAELIDNSVDQFIRMERNGTPIDDPVVHVAFGNDTVLVKDNGPGMSIDSLELAVKAGWTSQERFGSLGLYGVGFNIATARLGQVTTIWTTQKNDAEWFGLELDLRALSKGTTFFLGVKTRTKSDRNLSGTEIIVTKIKPDWLDNFVNGNWIKKNISERLATIYSTMLREDERAYPIRYSLLVNDKKVPAWKHCVWPADWTVYRKTEGLIRPIQEIDVTFGTIFLIKSTGEVRESREGLDPADVLEVPQRVYGWIGIQRYADEKQFGIDILRNGRKIEVLSKDLFDYEDENGAIETEYPIDDPRFRGRIVGEIHLDHGYVHYTKHKFEKDHSSWKHLLQAVRDNAPLTKRQPRGFEGQNRSPMGILFRAFRRNSPLAGQKYQDILFIRDVEKAKQWAEYYRKGRAPYTEDDFWRRELENSDREQPETEPPAPAPEGSEGAPTDIVTVVEGGGLTTAPELAIERRLNRGLSFQVQGIGRSGSTYDFETYEVTPRTLPANFPSWRGKTTVRGVYEIELNLSHEVFASSLFEPLDAVLLEMAHMITSEENSRVHQNEPINLSEVITELRRRHGGGQALDPNLMRAEIEQIRKAVIRLLSTKLSDLQVKSLMENLQKNEQQRIELAAAQGPEEASICDYFEYRHFASFIHSSPEAFLGSINLKRPWVPANLEGKDTLLKAYQQRIIDDFDLNISIIAEFLDPLSPEPTKGKLQLVRAAIARTRELVNV